MTKEEKEELRKRVLLEEMEEERGARTVVTVQKLMGIDGDDRWLKDVQHLYERLQELLAIEVKWKAYRQREEARCARQKRLRAEAKER